MTIPNQVTIKDLKSSIFEKIHKIPVDKQMLWHKPGEDYDFKDEDIKQNMPDGNKVKTIRIGSLQLCCETELILRYYNKIGLNKKRWFFSVFETELNDLEKLKIN